jgi:hypothetical protein
MFDSGVTADSLIKKLENEIDTPTEFNVDSCDYLVQFLNTAERLIYKNIIRENYIVSVPVTTNSDNTYQITLSDINSALDDTYSDINTNDIINIYSGDVELIKCSLAKYKYFDNVFSINDNTIMLKCDDYTPVEDNVDVKIIISPAAHTITKAGTGFTVSGNVMIPYEYVPMIEAYCRSEQYKLINEDTIAAKWANEFKAQTENFKSLVLSNIESIR